MKLCPNVSQIYDELINALPSYYSELNSAPSEYNTVPVSGFVHVLQFNNAVVIGDDNSLHLITADYTIFYDLHTGDRIDAAAAYNHVYQRSLITIVKKVYHVDYADKIGAKPTRSFMLKQQNINFGTSNLMMLPNNPAVYEAITTVFKDVPAKTKKIILSLDGRQEYFPTEPQLFLAKPAFSVCDKLSVCLAAFFHAKELASQGHDVVMVIDSLDKMFTVFNNCMQRVDAFDPTMISLPAMSDLESLLCSSKYLDDQSSLTIIGLHHPGFTEPQKFATQRFNQLFETIIQ